MKRRNKNPVIAVALLGGLVLFGCCCGPVSLLFPRLRGLPNSEPLASSDEETTRSSLSGSQPNLPPRSVAGTRSENLSIDPIANPAALSPNPSRGSGTQPPVAKAVNKSVAARLPAVEPIKDHTPAAREWTSGQFKTSGTYLGLKDGTVALQKSSGTANVPFERLSLADREYVKQMIRISGSENVIVAKVTAVIDGDTFTAVDEDKREYKVRLKGIDAPEIGQVYGDKAKQMLEKLILGHTPWIEWHQIDMQGCVEGKVYLAGESINLHMIGEGLAWHLKVEDGDARLRNAELVAQKNRTGLWSNESPAPPWEYRQHRLRTGQ